MTAPVIEIDPKLINLFCRLLGEEVRAGLTWESTMETTPGWDSLTFLDIVEEVEKDYGVKIPDDQIVTMRSLGEIQSLLDELRR